MPVSTTTPHPSTSGHSATAPGMATTAAGNTRLAYIHEGTSINKVQETHYYPFGHRISPLSNQPVNLGTERNNAFLYNGKEFNDDFGLNWYDYGARFYDAQIGRFHSVDPLASIFSKQSPYLYAANNPIRYIDYRGLAAVGADGLTNEQWLQVSRPSNGNRDEQARHYRISNRNKEQAQNYSLSVISSLPEGNYEKRSGQWGAWRYSHFAGFSSNSLALLGVINTWVVDWRFTNSMNMLTQSINTTSNSISLFGDAQTSLNDHLSSLRRSNLNPYRVNINSNPAKIDWVNPKHVRLAQNARALGRTGGLVDLGISFSNVLNNPNSVENYFDLGVSGFSFVPVMGPYFSLLVFGAKGEINQIQDNIMNNRNPLEGVYIPALGCYR